MYKNIVYHWTAGSYDPCKQNLEHYHSVFDKDGKEYKGKYIPSDNLNCIDGKYAHHTGGGNTGRIGRAICCMKDKNTPPTRKQIEAMCARVAQDCIDFGLQPKDCITHAEFGETHPKTTSFRKIDITSIPYADVYGIKECGDYLRNKTQVYYDRLKRK